MKCLTDYRVLAVHGLIASNALNFIHNAKCFPSLLPIYVKQTISDTVIKFLHRLHVYHLVFSRIKTTGLC